MVETEKDKKKPILYFLLSSMILISGCVDEKIPDYNSSKIKEPVLSYNPPEYSFTQGRYNNEEYTLPLEELPENYERDISGKFTLHLTDKQKEMLLTNGVVIVPGNNDRFENAYNHLTNSRIFTLNGTREYGESGVPIIITTDSVLHLFHIEFNELLKNIEINSLSPLLNEFLDESIKESIAQYNGLNNSELKELSRRNVAFLSVANKLLDPDFDVPGMVKDDVNDEIRRIEDHKGFYKSPLFSKDCPEVCETRLYPGEYDGALGDICNQNVKGNVMYEGKVWAFQDLYIQVASRKCYCEDYSQYVPRGHYTSSEGLKRYFKSMMWLGRMTFKARGENWTKQAVLLTDAVKSANAVESWNKIYTVTGFFAGASDDLTFYEYDTAVFNLFNYGFDENKELEQQITEKMQEELGRQRGPKILGGFEFDVAGNLKDTTQGMRVIGQRYALDSQVLSDLVYNNVGPNPSSKDYGKVIDFGFRNGILTKPPEFYVSCENMTADRVKYWNEVSESALHLYDSGQLTEEELYGVVRFMPTGLDVMSVLGSGRADEILAGKNVSDFCNYDSENAELKTLVKYYDQKTWTENLYNSWLWMLQPVIKEKPKGFPNWMRSELWRNKDLVTGLSSWAQLRHDTILYVKQSYTRATMKLGTTSVNVPMESKYYGYVEPNPELYARAGYITEFLVKGLDEQGLMTDDVRKSLGQSRDMMARLQDISEKELEGRALGEDDYNYIENIDSTFKKIIEDLASALTVSEEKPIGPGVSEKKSLEGEDDAFKTTLIADVHTEANTRKALEVGTGKIDWVVMAHASKDGRLGLSVGPMYSYYEFPWRMDDRLTDEKWREMLNAATPARPDWIVSYME